MAFDRTTDEYHLAPDGWVAGTSKYFSNIQKEVEPPIDCVETWERSMVQSSSFSKEHVSWRCIWKSPDYTDEERGKLKSKFPIPKD